MNKLNTLILGICATTAIGMGSLNLAAAADNKMMKDDAMAMEKKDAMMEKSPAMEKMHKGHEVAFSSGAFAEAQASGEPFLIAFHKKGCPMCASQKQALNEIYANPEYKNLKVLVVNYDTDTASLKKFNVGMQGALILYRGKNEISRSEALVKAPDIEKQIRSAG